MHGHLTNSPRLAICALLLAALFACATEGPPESSLERSSEPAAPGRPAPGTFELPALDAADYRWIASRIAWNETGGLDRHLTHWGEGEEFPSLGIGHFIWFPAGVDAPFDESFPALVAYVEQNAGDAAPMPGWLERQFRQQGL